ncbi:ABC transporter permease [Dactylosporangium aurantiacum]|uniref:ABC transporter permease n=1 Tax=Dactylosporangium aurantiacum TaxID=35754 RepID=A0A9Q9IEU8_9ACTN|nr:FtsX-like permease family protein [Dactylosporangium aurantiacum]MDG6103594.1 ABC transporter permease [Dactylosporangium aurantiacum]UWZ51913.1 ABC transporter permease [Dactylosporangium aurantiacum]
MALLVGVLTATTGFTVLTGATATARLQVTGTVDANVRAAYDILVRPRGSRLPLEDDRALLRPNAVSGIYGGITMDDWAKIRAVPGVDVAAPIAMAGTVNAAVGAPVDITDLVDRALDRQVIRVDRTLLADRGLSRAPATPVYVYVTKHDVAWPTSAGSDVVFPGGRTMPFKEFCGGNFGALEDGRPLCPFPEQGQVTDATTQDVFVVGLRADGTFDTGIGSRQPPQDRLVITVAWHEPMLVAAVDPQAEDRLVGLRGATQGTFLSDAPARTVSPAAGSPASKIVPVLATSRRYADTTAAVAMSRARIDGPLPSGDPGATLAALAAAPAARLREELLDTDAAYKHTTSTEMEREGNGFSFVYSHEWLLQIGGVTYLQSPDGGLTAVPVPYDPVAYLLPHTFGFPAPWQIDDTSFRTVHNVSVRVYGDMTKTELGVVGTFDPQRLTTFNPLSRVPMETYEPPLVVGADQHTRDLLGGRPLAPGANPAGYLSSPPMMLMGLDALPDLLDDTRGTDKAAPLSAVRVRVAGVHGFSATSRERVRLVAEDIAARTGLDVDITYGSSPAPQTVTLAAGRYQRPELRVTEHWVKKGVAANIITAVDRKSAVLFVLVLVVCALFLANAVTAGVRDRRTELATLSALGWPAHRVFAAVLGEVATIGAVAGLGALALAAPLGALLDVRTTWTQALLAVPTAVVLSLVAGLLPALGAARARPAAGLRPAVTRPRRAGRPRGPLSMGLLNLVRVPGRTALGAGALAIGIAAATVLGAITFTFHGAIVGTLLGDAVSLRVRAVDTIAAVATVLLGVLAVADVLYLNIRDRAAELATLRATGWTSAALGRLVAAEGLGIGVLGGVLGAGLGVAGAAWLVGDLTGGLLTTAAWAVAAGAVLAAGAALVPAVLLQRLPTAQLLADES